MVASVGYQGSFARDASKPFAFRSKEWTRVLTKQEKKKKVKPIVEEEDFEIMPEEKMAKRVVNFAVAPEGNNLATQRKGNIGLTSIRSNAKKKKIIKQKELSGAAFEKLLMEVKNQDQKLRETNKSIAVNIKMLQEQLCQGIKITRLQRELTEKIKKFGITRSKMIPLRKSDFEQNFKTIDLHMDDIRKLYEKMDLKCKHWKDSFKKHNMEHYTFIARNDTIPKDSEPFYVDPSGFVDTVAPDESNNYYEPFPVHLKRPSKCKKCEFVGHHRRCPSPQRIKKMNWNSMLTKETQELEHPYLFDPSTWHYQEPNKEYTMHPRHDHNTRLSKAHLVGHGYTNNEFDESYHENARQRSEEIFNATWNKKERIRATRRHENVPYTRIERAFATSAISLTTEGEIDNDEDKAKKTALELKSEMESIDAAEQIDRQRAQIDQLTKDLENSRKDRQSSTTSVTSHHPDIIAAPPTVISTSCHPSHGEFSHTMQAMLDKYESLDEDSKNELFRYAIGSGNENLQSRLLLLRQHKNGTTLAKLTKELIKLAESYKVPELKFDEQASKRRFNYQAWIMKLQPILAMFTQTAAVMPHDKIIPFTDPHALGNRALYLLISSRTDSYFQRAIKQFEPFGDKALELLQEQCAHISREDQSYFHERFVGLRIRDNESASSFLKRFTYARTTAEAASNAYSDDQLVDFFLAGLRSSKQDVYRTALQLYRLERLRGTKFTLRDIEQNFFQIDEGLGRDKRQLRTEHAMAAGGTHRGRHRGRPIHGRGRGRGGVYNRPQTASAHAAQHHSTITCYKCGEQGHIAPNCPSTTERPSKGHSSTSGQRPRTAPPARGHAATAQEGGSSNNTHSNTSTSGATSSTRSTGVSSSSRNAMVCMARTVQVVHALSARRVADNNNNPSNQTRPALLPTPTMTMDHEGVHFLDTDRYVTLIFPISPGAFNIILEDHIARRIAPAHYGGNLNPLDDGIWLILHDHPLTEVDHTFAAITYPNGVEDVVIQDGILPMLERRFHIPTDTLHNCVARFCFLVQAYLTHRIRHCWGLGYQDAPITVTARNNTLCVTFYPIIHDTPVLVQDGDELYIVPEHAIPRGMIVQHHISASGAPDEEKDDSAPQESARMAIATTSTGSAFAVRKKDPSLEDIGDPCDLGNFLPDSGATQHMTPRRADLLDVVEGQNLGVEVADGHVIKCSITGKIRLNMLDDNGNTLNAVLHDVMYVPGLSRRLFSITRFARHGHYATIRSGSTTLYFGAQQSPVTLTNDGTHTMAADATVINENEQHAVPSHRSHDHSVNKKRASLELLHQRLGHRKCRALLAASEHGVWADTLVRMGPEEECISCAISTARATKRNKEPHTGGVYPGEYVFLDILHPTVPVGLTKESTFPFYLILVDAYSRYSCIYGLQDKSSKCVIDTIIRYQADYGHIGNYGYLDIGRIRADSGTQFTSEEFKEHCWQAGISVSLAAPKKQYQNHLAERSWQTINAMARGLLVHARLPDSFMFHALLYSCHIFNVLPVKGLYLNGHVGTPYELFQGVKPRISHFRHFYRLSRRPQSKRISIL